MSEFMAVSQEKPRAAIVQAKKASRDRLAFDNS
jgi:hypothetical protein